MLGTVWWSQWRCLSHQVYDLYRVSWRAELEACLLSLLLLTFFSSFIQQAFMYLPRADRVLSTEQGAEAVFLNGHVPQSLVVRERVVTHYNTLCWYRSPEGTLFIKHLRYARPPRHEDPCLPSQGLGSHNTQLQNVDATVCVNRSPCSGASPVPQPSPPCLPSLCAPKLTTQAKL